MNLIDFRKIGVIIIKYESLRENMVYRFFYSPKLPETRSEAEFKELEYRFKRLEKGLEELSEKPELLQGKVRGIIKKIKDYGEIQIKEKEGGENKVVFLDEVIRKKYSNTLVESGNFPEESIAYALRIEDRTGNNLLMKVLKEGLTKSYLIIQKEMYHILRKLEEFGEERVKREKAQKVTNITEHPRFKKNVKRI